MTPLLLTALALGADDDLAKAVRALADAGSYQFTVRDGTAAAVAGKFQKDTPYHFEADGFEFFRRGDILVVKDADGWRKTRTGTLSDPLPILGASAKVRAARPPHEELGRLATELAGAKLADGVYTADLTEKAAKDLARTEERDLARGGTVKLWLDGKGRLAKYEVAITVKGRRGNADVDGVVTKAVTVTAVGSTAVDVPAAVKKALE